MGLKTEKLHIAVWIIIVVLTVMYAFFFLRSKNYLRNNDTFYYLSIADNILQNGKFLDATTVPNGPVITPQNGIVGLFCILQLLSFSQHQCVLVIVLLNLLLFMSCFYPLIQICREMGIVFPTIILLILVAFVSHERIFLWLYLSPLNDMFFYTGQIWLIFLILTLDKELSMEKKRTSVIRWVMALSFVLSIVLIHFRLNAVFIPFAGIAAALLIRRYQDVPFLLMQLLLMLMSLAVIYLLFVDSYNFEANTSHAASFFDHLWGRIDQMIFSLLPKSIFIDLGRTGNLLFFPFYLSLIVAFIDGLRQKNILLLMIFFICLMTILMTMLHGNHTERYLWVISIFMFVVLFRIKQFQPIGVLFVTVMVLSIFLPVREFWSSYQSKSNQIMAWERISEQLKKENRNPLILSRNNRYCWYFTGIPAVYQDKITWEQLSGAAGICVIGSQSYIDQHLDRIQDIAITYGMAMHSRPLNYGFDYPNLLMCELSFVLPNETEARKCSKEIDAFDQLQRTLNQEKTQADKQEHDQNDLKRQIAHFLSPVSSSNNMFTELKSDCPLAFE